MKYLINQKTVKNIKKNNLVLIWFVVGNLVNYFKKGKSSMNQKLKQAGLFAILAVFTMSLTTSFVGDAEASPQSRGELPPSTPEISSKTQQKANATPELKPETPRSASDASRPAAGPIEPSAKALHKAQILEKFKVKDSPSLLQVIVHDPATKSGKDFVVTGEVTTFTAVYAILNPANIDLRNAEILVTSDKDSVKGVLLGDYDKKHSVISVTIDAVDPASVNARIIG
jgi:hypothetical protein